ncbi:EamA family transporter RarD [Reinekea marinisedimentorum]|uniref:Chloramphenicol-sensitive protein RarD n=1 Tax=Reinekea marinisedimentorum TaxID=230495 RepID=A0A4R3I3E7_9GAMM|nr:EamA family transporter RarD [Reinekea marinisedimentorum]TCS40104.1 chloramphenicol-sensitive protein RarD [Reinekea marinisedimentorum]
MTKTDKDGVLLALCAYGLWGIAPVYFKWVSSVSALEILAHRILWSLVLTLLIILATRRLPKLIAAIRNRKIRTYLLISTLLVGCNWGIFIWAVNSDRMLSASLGYYINPLINIMLGMIFFAERLDGIKKLAAAMCLVAVGLEIYHFGQLPWIALALAITFALYGLVRKKIGVDSFVGMVLETGLMVPIALAYLFLSPATVWAGGEASPDIYGKLFLAGPVTMIPLLCFAAAANRISLTALGFFQYLGPSGMFLLAIFVYGEPISSEKLMTFVIIWSALALLIWDSIRKLSTRASRSQPETS